MAKKKNKKSGSKKLYILAGGGGLVAVALLVGPGLLASPKPVQIAPQAGSGTGSSASSSGVPSRGSTTTLPRLPESDRNPFG